MEKIETIFRRIRRKQNDKLSQILGPISNFVVRQDFQKMEQLCGGENMRRNV